ncbi:MAG: helix-turn-helix transcriptional regulator [Bacteroidota bacterium]|nr:helix-turn-helix domain-containing protein [uncultured Allomuricauda sp.]
MKNGNGPEGPQDCNDLMGEIGFQWFKLEDIYSLKNLPCENPFVSHRIQFFTLLLLTEGKIRHDVDFIPYTLDRGYCLFISPEQIHKFYKSTKGGGYVLSFTEDFIHRNFSRSSFSKINFLSNHFLNPSIFKDFGDIEIFMSALERELSLDLGIIKENLIASMLTVFLLKAQLYAEGSMKSYQGDFETFSKFQKLVSNYHKESRSVKHYANLLNISYKQLNNLSKGFTQRTAKEYINDYIILEIKRNLATTDFSIKEMAYEYGFKEGTNLTKFFKRATGDTPMKFKEIRLRNR